MRGENFEPSAEPEKEEPKEISRRSFLKGALGAAAAAALGGQEIKAEDKEGDSPAERKKIENNIKKLFSGSDYKVEIYDAGKEGILVEFFQNLELINEQNKKYMDSVSVGTGRIIPEGMGAWGKDIDGILQKTKKRAQEIMDIVKNKSNAEIDEADAKKANLLAEEIKATRSGFISKVCELYGYTEDETTMDELKPLFKERVTGEVVKLTDGGYGIKKTEEGKTRYTRLKPVKKEEK